MIRPEKARNALYALQGVLIRIRQLAAESAPSSELFALADYAEHLPSLIAASTDETKTFRDNLAAMADEFECAFVLQRFDEPAPVSW